MKKIYKQPPIVTEQPPMAVDPEIEKILGVDYATLNEAQRKCYQQFVDVYSNVDKNPFAVNMLQASNYCIPNNQYFAQYNATQAVAQITKNTSNEDEYIKLLKELLHSVVTPLNNAVDLAHENPTITYKDERFATYFTNTVKQLSRHYEQQQKFVKCNAELDQLLDGFLKDKSHAVWPPDEIPIILTPHSRSTVEIARTPHSRALIEMLWMAMTPADRDNDHIRTTRCCMSGESCQAITVVCNYNLFATTKTTSVYMFRMRPYEMLAKNTWDGNNPYTTCYFCVSYFFWKQVRRARAKGSLASIACSLPFVKEGFDKASFPDSLCVNKDHVLAPHIAYLSGSVLHENFYTYVHYDEEAHGFRYIEDRFPKH